MTVKVVIRIHDICHDYTMEEARELRSHMADVGWVEFAPEKPIMDENEEYTIREIYMKRD